jgi:GTP-binding protein EngB required for normal cell division
MDNSQMRQFIDSLHADGIEEWISLPEIAVMGDTSSGKSSLLS